MIHNQKLFLYLLFCMVLLDDRFYVNDVDNEVIARNIILLEIISSINPDNLADVEYLWDVWYNMTLTEGHYARLKVTLERLVDGSSSSQWKFGDRKTKKQAMKTWKSWLETEPCDIETVKNTRQEFLEYNWRLRSGTPLSDVTTMPSQPFCKNPNMVLWSTELLTGKWQKHVDEWNQVQKVGIARDFVSCNSSGDTGELINPTMMRPGSNKWHVHYGINPIEAYLPFER